MDFTEGTTKSHVGNCVKRFTHDVRFSQLIRCEITKDTWKTSCLATSLRALGFQTNIRTLRQSYRDLHQHTGNVMWGKCHCDSYESKQSWQLDSQ